MNGGGITNVLSAIQNGVIAGNNLAKLLSGSVGTDISGNSALVLSGIRRALSSDTTFSVRSDGSDTNTGLANTSTGAFLTLQKAVNTVAATDINTHNVTIQVAAGTYAGAAFNGQWLGSGTVTLTGDTATPTNVVISGGAANAISVTNCPMTIQGLRLTSSGRFLLTATNNSVVNIGGPMEWGAYSFGGISASVNSYVNNFSTGSQINGGGNGVFLATGTGGKFDNQVVGTWTVTAGSTITVTTFAFADSQSYINSNFLTWALGAGSSVTGTRFNVRNGAFINTGGGGANFFPGTVAGSGTNFGVAPWGLYL